MGLKTTFNSYVCFYSTFYDTKPDSDDDSGIVKTPTVSLDRTFTLKGCVEGNGGLLCRIPG